MATMTSKGTETLSNDPLCYVGFLIEIHGFVICPQGLCSGRLHPDETSKVGQRQGA